MMFSLLILLSFATEASSRAIYTSRPVYTSANQTLHRRINTAPIDNLVLRSPEFDNSTRYGIVLLVISATYEKAERDEIRKQWAAKNESKMQKSGESLVIFLVGRSSELDAESAISGDLLQVDIEETYRNLVYKIEVGYRWIQEKIDSEFVAKIDSDTVVHIDRLYDRLNRYQKEQNSDQWLICSVVTGAGPTRDTSERSYTSYYDYPHSVYPRFCNGPGYVMPRATFENIVGNMGKHTVTECEDVFFTGIVREPLGISFIGHGVVQTPYTTRSTCDDNGPLLSVLNTHYQFYWSKYEKDLTIAWTTLKNPKCRTSLYWWD